jgi:hypothetical protein
MPVSSQPAVSFGLGAMAMSEVGTHVAHLDLARILPHFELVEHAVVEEDAGEAFHRDQTEQRRNEDEQQIERDFHWTRAALAEVGLGAVSVVRS